MNCKSKSKEFIKILRVLANASSHKTNEGKTGSSIRFSILFPEAEKCMNLLGFSLAHRQ